MCPYIFFLRTQILNTTELTAVTETKGGVTVRDTAWTPPNTHTHTKNSLCFLALSESGCMHQRQKSAVLKPA